MLSLPLFVTTLCLAAGAIAVLWGFHGRCVDRHPVCRKCFFDLIGVYEPNGDTGAARCPECGRVLSPRRIRRGNRRRRRGAIVAGSFILIVGLGLGSALGWGTASGFDWNAVKPFWMLRSEATWPNAAAARASLQELLARLNRAELDQEQVTTLISIALDRQGDDDVAWEPLWGDIIEVAHLTGHIQEQDWMRYLRQGIEATSLSMVAREHIRPGDPLSCRLLRGSHRYATASRVDLLLHCVAAGLKDTVIQTGGSASYHGGSAPPRDGLQTLLWMDLPVGEHTIWVEWELAVRDPGSSFLDTTLIPGTQRLVRLETTVEVVAPETPLIELIDDPALAQTVREAVRVTLNATGRRPDAPAEIRLSLGPLPIGLAFDVFVRRDDGEQRVGYARYIPGSQGQAGFASMRIETLKADALDVILRPSADVALSHTQDLHAIWGQEIVLTSVPVQRSK